MELLPKGYYRARAIAGQLSTSKNKGTPQVELEFELLDEQYLGRRVNWCGYFTEKTEARTLESLRHCGWQGDDLTDLAGISDNEVQLVIDHEDYDGKTYARVQWVNRLGGVGFGAPMEDAAKRAFAARMRSKAAASRVTGGGSAKPAPKKPAKPAETDADEDAPPF